MMHHLASDTTITRHTMMTLLVVMLVTWLPTAILSIFEGSFYDGTIYSFLLDPDTQIRLMLAVPISVLCQPMIRYGCKIVTDYATRNLVPPDQLEERWLPVLERAKVLEHSIWVSIVIGILVAAMAARLMFAELSIIDSSEHLWYAHGGRDGASFTLAGWWYYLVAIPIYQFIMARVLWTYLVWIWVLWRLARTDLQIIAAHGDHMGGLSVLAKGQFGFVIYLFSMTTKVAGLLTLEILNGDLTFEAARVQMLTAVLVGLALVVAPMILFFNDLSDARRRAIIDYATLSTHYGRSFHERWIEGKAPTNETDDKIDASFVADFNVVYETATTIKLFPISLKGLIVTFVTLASPYILIMLTQFSPEQIVARLIDVLS
ncbi:MAG: hypothetical protein EHM43_03005 [Ignavibacteriae bacterium]|nr:MAG: hypothetical protein EHM43_03005 [Ignavibacteriota bacterium]